MGLAGACLGASVFKELAASRYPKLLLLASSASWLQTASPSSSAVSYYYSTTNSLSVNLGIANFALIFFLVCANALKQLIFGELTHREIATLRKKFHYTLWEFFLSLVVLKTFEAAKFNRMVIAKFACLFLCVLLLKFFHYLCVYRVSNVFNSGGESSATGDVADTDGAAENVSDNGNGNDNNNDNGNGNDSSIGSVNSRINDSHSQDEDGSTPHLFVPHNLDKELSDDEFDDLSTYNANEFALFNDFYLMNHHHHHHHLNNIAVPSNFDLSQFYHKTNPLTHLRFALGILLLNFIDVVLIIKFKQEIYNDHHNVLLILFGFEIINFYPLIILTSFNYILNYFEFRSNQSLFKKFLSNITQDLAFSNLHSKAILKKNYSKLMLQKNKNLLSKKKNLVVFKFFINNLKLLNQIIFSIFFLQYYTFPLHILSYSYNSFRICIIKLRLLINLKKFELKLGHFESKLQQVSECQLQSQAINSDNYPETCLICRVDFHSNDNDNENEDSDIQMLNCKHFFHHDCIITWLMKCNSCPVCHTKV